jgi:pimeloyl-ACP methyl ester carboxylesterase
MSPTSHRRIAATALACILVVAAGATLAPASGSRSDRPRAGLPSEAIAFLTGRANPDGANDFACKPSAAQPRPVVLVHGTFNNMRETWNTLSPQLAARGYCVFALNYGDTSDGVLPLKAVGPIASSAKELARFVERVRAATGAAKVDIVGYSQGGLMARQYLRFEGGAPRVHALVALAPSNRGTRTIWAETAGRSDVAIWLVHGACPSCSDQLWKSDFIRKLNRGPMTMTGVAYTVISTERDGVVQPYTSQQLPPGPDVENVTLQRVCPHNRATHLSIPYDADALGWVKHALDPAGTPPPRCA